MREAKELIEPNEQFYAQPLDVSSVAFLWKVSSNLYKNQIVAKALVKI